MDALNSYGLIFGITIGVLSAAFSFFNRQRYKTLITDIYQPGNDELRSQLTNARQEKSDCEQAVTEWKTKYDEQSKYVEKLEGLNLRLPDIANLTKQISNNHTEMIVKLTDLTEKIVERQ
jgi:maltodextrin utilization protein YvdJ